MAENSPLILAVIIPIYNEEKIIPQLYKRLKESVQKISNSYEFIFVNDGSEDQSLEELKKISSVDEQVYFINFSRNFGHQIAVTAGLEKCKGDVIVIIDGDLQDPPEIIPDLYHKHLEGFDVVYAKRNQREGESVFKKLSATLFYRILQSITSINIPLNTGDFRLINRKVLDNLNSMKEHNKFLRGQIAWLGFNQTEVVFDRDKREHGNTGYSVGKMFQFAIDGITGFSDKPLQLVTKLGFTFSFVSFIIILYAVYSHFILNRTITGWTSLIISTMFIGGIQLISIGVIGEYISRINKNVRNRPLYIIDETNLD